MRNGGGCEEEWAFTAQACDQHQVALCEGDPALALSGPKLGQLERTLVDLTDLERVTKVGQTWAKIKPESIELGTSSAVACCCFDSPNRWSWPESSVSAPT